MLISLALIEDKIGRVSRVIVLKVLNEYGQAVDQIKCSFCYLRLD